jgi:tRNA (guanine37-N1)-methyltransferase
VSLGDYILNGGEVAACALIETVARLVPGVLGNERSAARDTFAAGLLECPQFTRPREIEGLPVPAPLLSGHHAKIAEFEAAVSLVRTALLRPDMLTPPLSLAKALPHLEALTDAELTALGLTREILSELKQEWP